MNFPLCLLRKSLVHRQIIISGGKKSIMIITPSGEIEIFIDGNKIDYSASPVDITRNCNGLDGRFCVRTK
jgi:hypothetical protein